jgi:two-component system, chemotaxis family, chemotaxis protein CheY
MRVLVIDDDVAVRQTIALLLDDAGIDVIQAADGKEGLSLLPCSQPDLIVTDIIMPEKEGIETIMEIRKLDRDIPIIAISGGGRIGNADFLEIASRLGASVTLPKPFDPETLVDLVRKLGASRVS